jgi:mannose-6-phosphate isomerase-like protein (cupin superfamily)
MEHLEIIKDDQEILAIIIRKDFSTEGIKFFTPDDFSQQLAFMHHKKGKSIKPHVHNLVKREVHFTQEVLFVRRGMLKVDIYHNNQKYHSSHILNAGDVILLAGGGHGFEALEDIEMIEVKQGPYAGDMDKTHFEGIS